MPEEANLRAPETVVKLHAGFIAAGADLIETNTFGANCRKLAAHYLEDDLHAINSTGVKLARDAREMAGRDVFIAGSIGPLGELEAVSDEERTKIFAEQAEILEGRGVDLFSVETFFDLAELESAIAAVRSVSSLPILAMLTFDEQAETLAGVTARDAVNRLEELDVAAVGANHGAGIQAALRALNAMSGNGLLLAAMPNIGLASMAGNRIVYPHATPDYFAEFAAHARSPARESSAGAAARLRRRSPPSPRRWPGPSAGGAVRLRRARGGRPPGRGEGRDRAGSHVPGGRVRRLRPDRSSTRRQLRGDARRGADAAGFGQRLISSTSTTTRPARAAASALMLSVEIERSIGLETIPHLTTRDATIMGLESQLLGAHAVIRNVLSVTGDPPEVGDYPGSAASTRSTRSGSRT